MTHENEPLPESKKLEVARIKNLIENGFMHDWAIKIEYAIKSGQSSAEWVEWEKKFYAIKDSSEVIEEITACCKSNPDCSMKLVCEHFNPEFRLVYCFHRQKKEPVYKK